MTYQIQGPHTVEQITNPDGTKAVRYVAWTEQELIDSMYFPKPAKYNNDWDLK